MNDKETFEHELRTQIEEWTVVLGRLRAKVEKEYGDTRMNLMAEIEDLAAHQRQAETYWNELHQSQGDAWRDMKPDIELWRGQMRQALDRSWKLIQI